MSFKYRRLLKISMRASYILGILGIVFAMALSFVNEYVAAAPQSAPAFQANDYNCSDYDLKQDGMPGTTSDYRGSVTISSDSRTASWSANAGWIISAVCVKAGNPDGNNGYFNEWFYPNFSSWTAPDGTADISHAAVKFEEKVPTNTPVTPTNTPVTPTSTPTSTSTSTPTSTSTSTPTSTSTSTPTSTSTSTPTSTSTSTPTKTSTPVLETPGTPTNTPTNTPVTPTNTPVTPTATPQDPTSTPQEPTATPQDPTATPQEPTSTPQEPTATPQQPTSTPVLDTPTTPTTVVTTAVPTLPVPDVSETPSVLIPVTGADFSQTSPVDLAQKLAFNLGLGLIGLGLVLQGIRKYFG